MDAQSTDRRCGLTRHTTYRADLRFDNVAIMWEKVFIFKAVLDALLGVILLISTLYLWWFSLGD